MATIKELSVSRKEHYMVDPRNIVELEGFNVREETPELEAHIRRLADSIKEIGVQEPMTGYISDDKIILTNGHCRLKATMLVISEGTEIVSVPLRLEDRGTSDSDRVLSMITRNAGKPLEALEVAEVIKRLQALGMPDADIAKKSGYSLTGIANFLTLAAAPREVKEMVKDKEISPSMAIKTLAAEPETAKETLKEAVKVAKSKGHTKATDKHLDKTNWKKYGPKLMEASSKLRDVVWGSKEFNEAAMALFDIVLEIETK